MLQTSDHTLVYLRESENYSYYDEHDYVECMPSMRLLKIAYATAIHFLIQNNVEHYLLILTGYSLVPWKNNRCAR
jgi:hypothetical protein